MNICACAWMIDPSAWRSAFYIYRRSWIKQIFSPSGKRSFLYLPRRRERWVSAMAAKAIAQVLREVYIQLIICMTGHILCEWSFGIHATIYIYSVCWFEWRFICSRDVRWRCFTSDRWSIWISHKTHHCCDRTADAHPWSGQYTVFFLVCRQNMIIIGFNMQVRRTTMMDMPAHNQIKHQATTFRTHVLQYWLRQSWSFVLNVVYKQHGEVKVNAYYTTPACYIYQEEHRNAMRHQMNSKMHTWCTRVHSLKCTQIRNWTCSYKLTMMLTKTR